MVRQEDLTAQLARMRSTSTSSSANSNLNNHIHGKSIDDNDNKREHVDDSPSTVAAMAEIREGVQCSTAGEEGASGSDDDSIDTACKQGGCGGDSDSNDPRSPPTMTEAAIEIAPPTASMDANDVGSSNGDEGDGDVDGNDNDTPPSSKERDKTILLVEQPPSENTRLTKENESRTPMVDETTTTLRHTNENETPYRGIATHNDTATTSSIIAKGRARSSSLPSSNANSVLVEELTAENARLRDETLRLTKDNEDLDRLLDELCEVESETAPKRIHFDNHECMPASLNSFTDDDDEESSDKDSEYEAEIEALNVQITEFHALLDGTTHELEKRKRELGEV